MKMHAAAARPTADDADRSGKSINHVSRACSNCQRGHVGCDDQRPCSRCVRTGRQDSCVNGEQRKRGWRKGRARNPTATLAENGSSLTLSIGSANSTPPASPRANGAHDISLGLKDNARSGSQAALYAAQAVLALQKGQPSPSPLKIPGSSSPNVSHLSAAQTLPGSSPFQLPRLLADGTPAYFLPVSVPPSPNSNSAATGAGVVNGQQQRPFTVPNLLPLIPSMDALLAPMNLHNTYSPPSPLGSSFGSPSSILSRDAMSGSRESLSSASRDSLSSVGSRDSLVSFGSRESIHQHSSNPRLDSNFTLKLSLNNGIIVLGCDGQLFSITGLHPEDILGFSLPELLHSSDAALVLRVLDFAVLIPNEPFTTVIRIKRPSNSDGANNEYVWLELFGRIECNPATGRPVTAVVVAHALQLANASDNNQFEMRHALQGGCLDVSPAIKSVLGHDPERLRANDIFCIAHEQDQIFMRMALSRLLSNNSKECRLRLRLQASDDTYKWFEATAKVVSSPFSTEPSWISCTFRLLQDEMETSPHAAISCSTPTRL